ncbi:glycoside hydrolase family 88 protein [Acuticoccus sp. MNP-M23]|uniref:beta-galactosidase BglB n=1 Tax=Acuticoccus sp. MNP-M23 TaxID=3072793 RepID=UPI002814CB3E|nr:glycoside hydrolase family 88 protein [Acuticoccus sp. MNP-M23]WMS44941.1 glycoside hydrolase family 88 protein [Acuticoccus sp. MNP-M23]
MSRLETNLHQLVTGMTALRHEGQFDEPNLDGTKGDYISFDSWEWPQGVGLYALASLWRAGHLPRLKNELEGWYQRRIEAGLPAQNVNTTAPMLALSLLWRESGDPAHGALLAKWAEDVLEHAPRTEEGGIQHDVSDKKNRGELWDDTLFMVALFLASYGEGAGRRDLVDEAERQFLVHTRYLADPATGLWFHGWTFDGRHNFARARWARGNAWISAGVLDLLDLATIAPSVAAFLTGVLKAQVDALLPLQCQSGAWRTLLDDPSSYEELSATAGFGYALLKGARLGLGTPAWKAAGIKAVHAVMASIDDTGTLQNVSYGTRMGHDLDFYRTIPIQPTAYGQAMALLCLGEAMNHDDLR